VVHFSVDRTVSVVMMHSPSLDGPQTMERREELRIAEVAGGSRWVRQAEVVEEKKLMGGNRRRGGSGGGELGIRKEDDVERNLGSGELGIRKEDDVERNLGSGELGIRKEDGVERNLGGGELGIRKEDDMARNLGGGYGSGNADERSVREERTSSVVGNSVDLNSGQVRGDGAIADSKLMGNRKPRTSSVVGKLVDLNSGQGNGGGAIAESKLMGNRKTRTSSDGDDVDVNGVGDHIVEDGNDASVGASSIPAKVVDECEGRYIYEHKMDPYFNSDLLKQCKKLNLWQDLCPMLQNGGLGPKLNNTSGVFSDSDWYQTNQFMLEEIFHNRMRRYKCLTNDSKQADAIFVPFYAGLEISMNLWGANITVRDTAPKRLFNWLTAQPEWKRFNGHDHFLVGGRITWDFRRETDEEKDWGNKLFILPPSLNMTMLAIEASPFHHNDFAVPYPTYFHPSSKQSIQNWQARMRNMERKSLFSFVGAPRPDYITDVRGKIIHQCIGSSYCRLLNCSDDHNRICSYPENVMEVFEHSVFCLQPTGDSYTRRSTFDSMLAGCIPVFFHEFAAYSQYVWHLPANHSSYSVYINVNTTSIEEALLKYSEKEIRNMREVVIQTIPAIVYSDPRSSPIGDVKDAFDISLQVGFSDSTTSSGFSLDSISPGVLFVRSARGLCTIDDDIQQLA
jgi:hypothetical protein